jgi:hypothetical protein
MGRVTSDREPCPDREELSHLWELAEDAVVLHVCHYCGAERLSRWIDKEESDNRKENES